MPLAQCKAPGCKLAEFHDGLHSFEKVGMKLCLPSLPKTEACVMDAHGMTSYNGTCKGGQRVDFLNLARASKKPVLYLDGPDAELTKLLIHNGVEKERLVVVNKSRVVAEEISRATGAKCIVGDICEYASKCKPQEFAAAWFDMCGTSFGKFRVSQIVECAHDKFFTLSSRACLAEEQKAALTDLLRFADQKIVQTTLYTGASGKAMNMVFVKCASRESMSPTKKHCLSEMEGDESTTTGGGIAVGTVVMIPLTFWKDQRFLQDHEYSMIPTGRGKCLVGSVLSYVTNSTTQLWLTFNLKQGGGPSAAE
jgi:hypothetical protein